MGIAGAGAATGAAPRSPRRASRWLPVVVAAGAKLKLLLVVGSALLSVAVYAIGFGWALAVGFVALLALHELGHVIAMRLKGFPASAPYFIPMLGAVIFARRAPRDAGEDAFIGAGGPVTGVAASWLALALHAVTGREVFAALAVLGFLVHLFNLLPVSPLDGGRILAFLRWWVWVPAFCALLLVFTYDFQMQRFGVPGPFGSVILAFVLMNLAGEWAADRRWRTRPAGASGGAPTRAAVGTDVGCPSTETAADAGAAWPAPLVTSDGSLSALRVGPPWPVGAGWRASAADAEVAAARQGGDAAAGTGAAPAPARARHAATADREARSLSTPARLACLAAWLGLALTTVAGFAFALAASPAAYAALTR